MSGLDGIPVMSGSVEVRPEGSLSISEPRELLVAPWTRAGFRPDGSVDRETIRWWGAGEGSAIEDIEPLADREIVAEYDEEVLWGGWMIGHFGHFLIESATRLWPLLPSGPLESMPVIFTTPLSDPFIVEWLRAFGVEPAPLPPQGTVRFKKVRVPQPALRIDDYVTPEFRRIHLRAREGLEPPPGASGGVVWLSRTGIERERRVRDEALLEWLLEDELEVIRPETLSLAEQVGVVERAGALAGTLGSAFHSLLLAREPPPRLYLTSARVPSPYTAQDNLLGDSSLYAQALSVTELRLHPRTRRESHRVSIPEALRALDASVMPGLLRDPRLAGFADPGLPAARVSEAAEAEPDLDQLVRRAILDPQSLGARMELGGALEGAGSDDCALEQFLHVADLTDDYAYAPLRAARLLARLGENEQASGLARDVLAIDPDSEEAARYAALADSA
jgi:Glycosyltransferase 61